MKGNSKTAHHYATTPASGARRSAKGRRRQGSKPDGRDSARGAGRSPRARRRHAGTRNASHWGKTYNRDWRGLGLCRYCKKYWFGLKDCLHGKATQLRACWPNGR
ncbi:MAG: hypothetical protein EPN64_12435 [Burkholderiaceae bacterium]|nr:MAG: hypothetical protein EPN64_12435 [Burkholderiaceae bacterium]